MMNKIVYIHTEKRDYPAVMNLNILESIQDEYGSYSEWESRMSERDLTAIKYTAYLMINEAVDILNEDGADEKPVTKKQVGRIVSEAGFSKFAELFRDMKADNTPEDEIKNA